MKFIHYLGISNRTTSASNVSESTNTSSLVSANLGIAINLTFWPSGPLIDAVSNFGCDPTKKRCGHEVSTKGSSSWNG
jgi:hypothetical protein